MRILALAALAFSLSACMSSRTETAAPAAARATAPVGPALAGPILGPDGRCTGPTPSSAATIAPGIGECELVRLKGKPPTDVLVGESGKGGREVQVLYAEPGAKELYLFVDNRLERIVK